MNDMTTTQILNSISKVFLQRLRTSDPNATADQARAMTAIYLTMAFNPNREKMKIPDLLKHLGLTRDSNHVTENSQNLKQLAEHLKNYGNDVRREILTYMRSAMVDERVLSQVVLNHAAQNFLVISPFNLTESDLKAFAKACDQGIDFLDSKKKIEKKLEKNLARMMGAGGAVGGLYLHDLLVEGFWATGIVSVSSPLGVGICLGAIVIATVVTGLLLYGIYRLGSYAINHAFQSYEYNSSVQKEGQAERLTHAINGFLYDNNPEKQLLFIANDLKAEEVDGQWALLPQPG